MVYVSLSLSLWICFVRRFTQPNLSRTWPSLAFSLFRDLSTNTSQVHLLSLSLSLTHTSHTVLCVCSISLFLFMVSALRRLGVKGVEIRKPAQLDSVASLIIPGGESTTMAKLAEYHNLVLSLTLYIFIFKKCFLRKYNQTTLKIQLGS